MKSQNANQTIFCILLCLSIILISPVLGDETCVDENPEIILDLGGSSKPEK